MNKYIVELIGTFFLVLTIGMTENPIVIGSALISMIYAAGHISGAHFNPAVTVAFHIRGKCKMSNIFPYIIAQLIGGVLAALIVTQIFNKGVDTPKTIEIMPSLVAEVLATFALVYVILNVATAKANEGNSFYGAAIGLAVFAMASIFGDISGGAFNPAVAISASMIGAFDWANIWVFLVANFIGGALAAIVFNLTCEE